MATPAPDEELPIRIQTPATNGSATKPSKSSGRKKSKAPSSSKAKRKAKTAGVSEPGAPAQWEYLTVVFRDYDGWRPRMVDGQEVGGWKKQPPIHEYLAALGAEGWEMVSMGERHRNQKEAYFKRQVVDVAGG